jgi:prophage antirepressor-like protein
MYMKEIAIFNHKMFGEIRAMTAENGEVLFVGKDVATALGYSDSRKAIRVHVDEEDKGVDEMATPGGKQKVILINESGLYSMVLSSKLPQAKAFKRWVTSEVLPQIRRTGGYIPTRDANGRQLGEKEIVGAAISILRRTLQQNTLAENCLTATEVASSWGMDVHSFNQLLCRMGIQHREHRRWVIANGLNDRRLTRDRLFIYFSLAGELKSRSYMVWTPEGVRYLNNRFMTSDSKQPKIIQLNLFVDTAGYIAAPENQA